MLQFVSHVVAVLSAGLTLVLAPLPYQLLVFVFQADDGIRVLIVTGVQTCALPILPERGSWILPLMSFSEAGVAVTLHSDADRKSVV